MEDKTALFILINRWSKSPEDSLQLNADMNKFMGQMFPPIDSVMMRGYVPIRADYRCKENNKN